MNIILIEDRVARLTPLIRRIETELGHTCSVFQSVADARNFISQPDSEVLGIVINQRLLGPGGHSFGALPIIIVSDGLPVDASLMMRAENVLDYVMDYAPHNHGQIVSLLRRSQFHGIMKILVVDAETTVRNLFANLLKKHGLHVLQARNSREAMECLEGNPEIRLVLTDMEIPGMQSGALIHAIRERYSKQQLPIIGLADEHVDGVAVQFLRLGANDVISMPPRTLFEVQVRVMQNLALTEAFQEIVELSRKDFLTGLYNRRYFYETAETVFAQMRRGRIKVAVAMVDIDNFKKVNDSLGHAAGDLAIIETARLLKVNLRDTDVLARFGGEEFCILLAGLESSADAVLVTERLVNKVAANRLVFEEHEFKITISCGVCLQSKEKLEAMIQESDRLLYVAKSLGKNRVVADA